MATNVYIRTEEHRRKMSEGHKKLGIGKWMRGDISYFVPTATGLKEMRITRESRRKQVKIFYQKIYMKFTVKKAWANRSCFNGYGLEPYMLYGSPRGTRSQHPIGKDAYITGEYAYCKDCFEELEFDKLVNS